MMFCSNFSALFTAVALFVVLLPSVLELRGTYTLLNTVKRCGRVIKQHNAHSKARGRNVEKIL